MSRTPGPISITQMASEHLRTSLYCSHFFPGHSILDAAKERCNEVPALCTVTSGDRDAKAARPGKPTRTELYAVEGYSSLSFVASPIPC